MHSSCPTDQRQPFLPVSDAAVDVNVRIDYGRLRHLLVTGREAGARLNGNFDLLRHVAGTGGADADVNLSFPREELVEPETSCRCFTTSAC